MTTDHAVTLVAYAIYAAWTRDCDMERAWRRFRRMPDLIRRDWERQATAAIVAMRKIQTGEIDHRLECEEYNHAD